MRCRASDAGKKLKDHAKRRLQGPQRDLCTLAMHKNTAPTGYFNLCAGDYDNFSSKLAKLEDQIYLLSSDCFECLC